MTGVGVRGSRSPPRGCALLSRRVRAHGPRGGGLSHWDSAFLCSGFFLRPSAQVGGLQPQRGVSTRPGEGFASLLAHPHLGLPVSASEGQGQTRCRRSLRNGVSVVSSRP